jgi:hypothetical protein
MFSSKRESALLKGKKGLKEFRLLQERHVKNQEIYWQPKVNNETKIM